ncbi:hypothetical protein OH76DRAFT_696387 [Lentinus brumalis]|uniref:Uncharacterized protein n=1 Tax=Lentinus brumalis TaxID=2498619 RepID=A0A371D6D5_9APHY|nr:hypothetical protein OH76DRAFT_696387 [Polyporus brumalis]
MTFSIDERFLDINRPVARELRPLGEHVPRRAWSPQFRLVAARPLALEDWMRATDYTGGAADGRRRRPGHCAAERRARRAAGGCNYSKISNAAPAPHVRGLPSLCGCPTIRVGVSVISSRVNVRQLVRLLPRPRLAWRLTFGPAWYVSSLPGPSRRAREGVSRNSQLVPR